MNHPAYLAATPSPASGGGLDFTNLSTFLTDNVVPLACTVLGIIVFLLARKKKISEVFEKFGIALIAFMIIAMGANSLGINIAGKVLTTVFG